MKRLSWLTWIQLRRNVLMWAGSWWFALAMSAAAIVPPLVSMAVWTSVLPDTRTISVYYLAIVTVQVATASYENHTFSSTIYRGTITARLVEPQPIILAPFAENIAIRLLVTSMAIPVLVIVGVASRVQLEINLLWAALPSLMVAGLLRFVFTFLLSLSAFWHDKFHAVAEFSFMLTFLLGGAAVPLALLPSAASDILRVLPFYSMLGFPAEIASGTTSDRMLEGLLMQFAWLAGLVLVTVIVWHRGLARYAATAS